MKTAPRIAEKANFVRAILLVAFTILLGSTGCQKEDELMPSANKTVYESGSNSTTTDLSKGTTYYDLNFENGDESVVNINENGIAVFNVIKINHEAGNSRLPDYTVLVRSDGWVIYDGHRNVRVQDKVTFQISIKAMATLKGIFDKYGFYTIVPDFEVAPGLPVVYTTYRPTQFVRPRTIYDDCYNNPEKLVLIRKSVEHVLGIDRYVVTDWETQTFEPSF